MKSITFLLLPLLFSCKCQAQDQEFRTNPNGLMYSDSAMAKLRLMVNTQNILFKTCDLNKTFYSQPQAHIFTITFKSKQNNLKDIRSALDEGKSFYDILQTYRSFVTDVDSGGICIKGMETEEGKETAYFLKGSPGEGYREVYQSKENSATKLPNTWEYDYEASNEYNKFYQVTATWYVEPFRQKPIPPEYGKLIQYVDCMIDTNAQVFLSDKYSGSYFDESPKVRSNSITYVKAKAKEECVVLRSGEDKQNSLTQFAATTLKNDTTLLRLIKDEVANTVATGLPATDLEALCDALELRHELLTLMRSRRVMGMCSQDDRPRRHALEIASLAGETQQWDIFMRAHMDILNDSFERMTDGSYAWEKRQTYLKELEELGLHVSDIMLGMSLRASNTATNHYSGTVWRLGKAMTECSSRKDFETATIHLIFDTSLDDFNRGLCFLLLSSYLHRLPDVAEANGIIQTLKKENTLAANDHIGMAIQQMDLIKKEKTNSRR